ncbi:hypothetical protein DFH28DRAFT_1082273 [Melampsora americana]|nr:hypothetical protein DFH28DRAFT_1082273 [Melampsora americana]
MQHVCDDSLLNMLPYYGSLPDLGVRDAGTLYRLQPKRTGQDHTSYDQEEDVYVFEDRVLYNKYGQVQARCFAHMESNRHAAMALKCFQRLLFLKIRDVKGRLIPKYQQWYLHACAMVIQPCYGATDISHSFVHKDNFNNPPGAPHTWTHLIHAFIHYTYNLSADKTLISNLDCDDHGKISNLIRYVRDQPPYHSRDNANMACVVDRQFNRCDNQHVCNKICELLGNVKLGNFTQ